MRISLKAKMLCGFSLAEQSAAGIEQTSAHPNRRIAQWKIFQ